MEHAALAAEARAEFADAVRSAIAEAARTGRTRPTLAMIARASHKEGRPSCSTSAISAWKKGDRIPASWSVVESFLTALEKAASLPRGKFDRRDWERLFKRAQSAPPAASASHVATLLVRDADPLELKVHRARTTSAGNAVPDYIPRDVDSAVRTALARVRDDGGVILLVGASTAGKTRCAYEAMRNVMPDHLLVAPSHVSELPDAVTQAVRAAKSDTGCVLWLNDTEKFLGPGGLTLQDIRALRRSGTVLLGTMRSRIRADFPSNELVRLAEEFEVPRLWSPSELERVREHLRSKHDDRLRLALEQSEDFGISETLAAGPQLWRELISASVVDGHPRGAALVWTAIDIALAGLVEPLPVDLLEELHEEYLPGRNKQLIRPESMDEALAWAGSPYDDGVTRLLIPEGEGLRAFDYLLDAHLQERGASPELIPERIWDIVLSLGHQRHQRFSIALAAHANDRMDVGRRALLPLAEANDVDALRTLGLLYERSDRQEAIQWLQLAIDAGDVLALRLMGNLHFRNQDRRTAGDWYWRAARAGDEVSESYYNEPRADSRPVPEPLTPPASPVKENAEEEDWEDEGGYYGPTARTLCVLEGALENAADMAYDVVDEIGERRIDLRHKYAYIYSDLPVLTWGMDAQWRRRMARCFHDLAADIKAGKWPLPTCTGEEMALHIAIEHASTMVVDEPEFVSPWVADLPAHHDDWDWGLCYDTLFEDTDVLFLYEPWSQGIEDSRSLVHQHLGIANLEAEDWFKPFRADDARDPDRGFHR
ncbi:tetratricopeptide repeat protein [Streptomyces sp. NPDC059002]|uniref:tetratricopeptide repeat protein n=1 Tax=Streptomyces sp. NPDC059002 TaxID=3346690 RepID=UPI0036A4624C